ncbi:MAG: insulinase family protein, partial [Polyangiales bacterium]
MSRLLTVLSSVAVVGCGTLIKPPDPDRKLDVRTAGTTFDSDRGYRFVVLPEPNANVIRVDVRYPVGSIDDPAGKEGLAHLVEHLLTEVEVTRDGVKTSLDGELGRVALSYNASTTTDYTSYEVLALPSALDDLMRVEGERLATGCAGIPRTLFDREREVVRNELRQRAGGGGSELLRQVHEAIYPAGHPYRRVDSAETVANITYEDVCAFVVGPYRRGTAIVAISGAVDVPALQASVANQFARVPKRTPAAVVAIPPAPVQPGTVRIRGAVDEPTLLITWPLPPMSSNYYRFLEIAWGRIAGNLEDYAFTFH